MKQIQLVITANDIRTGTRRNTDYCPIALSAKRQFNEPDVEVDFDTVRIGRRMFEVSRRAEDWMNAFDDGGTVAPTWFLFNQVRAVRA